MPERRHVLAAVAGAAVAAFAHPQAAAGQASWRLEQPDPPAGYEFRTPLGPPGDLQFWSRNRGLLGVEGNSAIPRGLYRWDGERWTQLATVCGGPADTMRIAWAGPTEFWTVSEPSPPRRGGGITLCRFKDGEVVASYGTPDQSSDPYRPMNAATCLTGADCWFGGIGTQGAAGTRRGAFHLHWDGASLQTVYNPQGRGVSDLEAHAGTVFESVLVGRQAESAAPAELAQAESPRPRLLHRIVNRAFANDRFVPADEPGEPEDGDGVEMLALDSSGTELWAAGAGAASGPEAEEAGGMVPRRPLLARLVDDRFEEVELLAEPETFGETDRLVDVAAVPGTDDAWLAVQPFEDRRRTNVDARVARVDGETGTVESFTLPASGSGRGSAAKVAFTGANEGWLVTSAGWLFHWTDGSRVARDDDPAFARLIDFRPNENAEQFIPDSPPVDDASTLAPPPLEVTVAPVVDPAVVEPQQLEALLKRIRVKRRGLRLLVTFTVARRARISLIALRRGKRVARSKPKVFRPGKRRIVLRLSRRRWPTRLRLATAELDLPAGAGAEGEAGAGDTVTTGGPPPATQDATVTTGGPPSARRTSSGPAPRAASAASRRAAASGVSRRTASGASSPAGGGR